MRRIGIGTLAFVFVLGFGAALPATVLAGPIYSVTDLGTLGGSSGAWGINNSGQVVGGSYLPGDLSSHPFLSSNGTMTDLGTLGGPSGFATAINASGQVVGMSFTATSPRQHVFFYSGGVMQDLGLGVNPAINAPGQVTFNITVPDGNYRALLYSNNTTTDLGTLGGSASGVSGINDTGLIVGGSYLPGDLSSHAFLDNNGVMQDLGTLGGTNSGAYGINASGQIVGSSQITGDAAYHAFLLSNGLMTDLGTLGGTMSDATAINASGQIIGDSATSAPGTTAPFLYSGGTMYDLNSLIDPRSGWHLSNAGGINDLGQIVGAGTDINGNARALLLTPINVPEPSGLLLAALGFLALVVAKYARSSRPCKSFFAGS